MSGYISPPPFLPPCFLWNTYTHTRTTVSCSSVLLRTLYEELPSRIRACKHEIDWMLEVFLFYTSATLLGFSLLVSSHVLEACTVPFTSFCGPTLGTGGFLRPPPSQSTTYLPPAHTLAQWSSFGSLNTVPLEVLAPPPSPPPRESNSLGTQPDPAGQTIKKNSFVFAKFPFDENSVTGAGVPIVVVRKLR